VEPSDIKKTPTQPFGDSTALKVKPAGNKKPSLKFLKCSIVSSIEENFVLKFEILKLKFSQKFNFKNS
jgi:hypothetical protein